MALPDDISDTLPDPGRTPVPAFDGLYQVRDRIIDQWRVGGPATRCTGAYIKREFVNPHQRLTVGTPGIARRIPTSNPPQPSEFVFPLQFWDCEHDDDPATGRRALLIGAHLAAVDRLPGHDSTGLEAPRTRAEMEPDVGVRPDEVIRVDEAAWVWALLRALRDDGPLCDHPTDPTRTLAGLVIDALNDGTDRARLDVRNGSGARRSVAKRLEHTHERGQNLLRFLSVLVADGAPILGRDAMRLEQAVGAFNALRQGRHVPPLVMPLTLRRVWERGMLEAAAAPVERDISRTVRRM